MAEYKDRESGRSMETSGDPRQANRTSTGHGESATNQHEVGNESTSSGRMSNEGDAKGREPKFRRQEPTPGGWKPNPPENTGHGPFSPHGESSRSEDEPQRKAS